VPEAWPAHLGSGTDGGALRKKFDAILEYSCHLTQERDFMAAQLKEIKRQQVRDAGSVSGNKTGNGIGNDSTSTDASVALQGKANPAGLFPLSMVVIIGLISFLIGRFLRTDPDQGGREFTHKYI